MSPTRRVARRGPRRAVLVPPVLAAAVFLNAACGAADDVAGSSSSVARPTVSAVPPPDVATTVAPGAQGPQGPAATAPAVPAGQRPVRVVIQRIGVDSSLVDLGVTPDGTMEVPADYQRAGWLDVGPAPGQTGPAVIAGHVDSKTGPAVFYRLRELRVGDAVTVVRADGGTVHFTVDNVEQYAKARFPTDAVYGPVPGPVLRLITCGGSFDRRIGHYRDNIVVYAS